MLNFCKFKYIFNLKENSVSYIFNLYLFYYFKFDSLEDVF